MIISTGTSRKTISWYNQEITWSELSAKLAQPRVTRETIAEYDGMSKSDRNEIKDVGGFVGGYLAQGRRNKESIRSRSLITLDVDYASSVAEVSDAVKALSCDAVIYSTHSHRDHSVRLRVVIPIDRECTPAEYGAISRRVASQIGIDIFDDTTYDPCRLMYWPSISKDGKKGYVYIVMYGGHLCADDVLRTYRDWRDTSSWPISSRSDTVIARTVDRAGSPTEKPGIVGAFCRAYTISAAISELIPDVYTPCGANRYTYTGGTAVGGLVVYDDAHVYSHHGTDPCSGKLCNSFDLVRIHKFGSLDAGAAPDTPVNRLPSYTQMTSYALTLPSVKMSCVMRTSPGEDFADVDVADDDFTEQLSVDKRGVIVSNLTNMQAIMLHDKKLRCIYNDVFVGRYIVTSELPWSSEYPRYWSNADDSCLQVYLDKHWKVNGQQKVITAFEAVMERRKVHPVRDYFRSLSWDNTARLDTMLTDYLGVEDCELTRAFARKVLCAAVKRIFEPGAKFDYILLLIGPEGCGKSTLVAKLGGKWYSDSLQTMEGKESSEALQGVMIMEVSELLAYKRSEGEAIKAFLSRTSDDYRPAYGRRKERHPRQNIFIGTTNTYNPLKGDEGNRRFWPVACMAVERKKNPFTMSQEDIDQLWAEAYVRYMAGETLYLSEELEQQARAMQQQRNEVNDDPRLAMIIEYIKRLLPCNWDMLRADERHSFIISKTNVFLHGVDRRKTVSSIEILCECFGERIDERAKFKTREINALLARIKGVVKTNKIQTLTNYGRQRIYDVTESFFEEYDKYYGCNNDQNCNNATTTMQPSETCIVSSLLQPLLQDNSNDFQQVF